MTLNNEEIRALGLDIGFDIVKFCDASKPWPYGEALQEFIEDGRHASMEWFKTTFERRSHPTNMWSDAKTAIVLGTNYGPKFSPFANLEKKDEATISVYAQNNDYHDLIKKRLKVLAGEIHRKLKCEVKVFVDTAPLMEKPLAKQAGLGWVGKHSNIVSREFGSWLFLGIILVAHEFEYDAEEADHCGKCSKCIDICPTGAIIAPYKVDARRCISYLNIEHKGLIAEELMDKMGNRIYGCDDCLGICPWNKFAKPTIEENFLPRTSNINPKLLELLKLDDTSFRERFKKSPIKRIGVNSFLRNIIIAIGNSNIKDFIKYLEDFLNHEDEGIKTAALWAHNKLKDN